jgi:choline dehydrogenase-like flavoprotein
MICAGESLADGGTTQADIAIVGGGPVGLALAVRLAGRVSRVILVEAGTTKFIAGDNLSFFKAEHVDDERHAPAELYRRRMLGGTTSVWGGRCIPFDPEDFAATPDRLGWPISFDDFNAYVPRALEFLDSGAPEFSASVALPGQAIPVNTTANDLNLDRIERYSKPTNAWQKWGATLTRSNDVTIVKGATCTNVLTNAEGTRVNGLELKTVSNRSHTVVASTIVLACGGLETPRLLLGSRKGLACGLGNERGLVGRFYMSHLVSSALNAGVLSFASAKTARAFDFAKTVDRVYGRRMILLSPEARQRERLPNIVFRPGRPPMDDATQRDAVLSAMYLVRNLLIPPEYARSMASRLGSLPASQTWRDHGRNIFSGIPELTRFSADWLVRRVLATRKLPSVFFYRKDGRYPLEFNAEQMPNPDSRVTLGSETDSFGMPRLKIHWRYFESELDSICRAYRVLALAAVKSGLGEVTFGADLRDSVQRALVPQGGHHIGTVRMGTDASTGVVNSDGEVWGTHGLFVAGTSILPTSGFANPTLTAVALAFRLAEHIVRRQNTTGAD